MDKNLKRIEKERILKEVLEDYSRPVTPLQGLRNYEKLMESGILKKESQGHWIINL